jgi:tripartite-type tricarboxylate transporter receptor subunit TctC
MGHIAIERLASITGVEFLHVPYKGTAQAFPDLIGGQVPLMLDNLVTALPQIQGGKVRAIAFTGRSRSPQLPNVPTFRELGFTEMEAMNFYGLFAPAGTPPNVIRQLNLEVKRIFSKPEIKQQFVSAGAVVTPGSPQEFSTFLEIQGIVWGAVIRSRGIKPD